jgi:alkanesulfonate monooxygenase SsuD/methylene tetrahydromethanopterin reductase-like flavin-dependent oxidoreductase (luciferase family)
VRLAPADHARTESPTQVLERFGELSDAGAQHVIVELKDVHEPAVLEAFVRDVVPAAQALP